MNIGVHVLYLLELVSLVFLSISLCIHLFVVVALGIKLYMHSLSQSTNINILPLKLEYTTF